jgi:type IV secretory pathway VirB10-like protein
VRKDQDGAARSGQEQSNRSAISGGGGLPPWLNLTTSAVLGAALFLSGLGAGTQLASSSQQQPAQAAAPAQQAERGAAAPPSPTFNPKQPPVVIDSQDLSAEEVGSR